MVNSKLRRHKVMEKVIKKLFGNNLPPRFKFKDTYASIEVPQAYQQHMPTQQQIEAEFDEMIIKEEEAPTVVVPTEDLKIIATNLYSNVTTSNIGIGTVAPGYTLDVVGDINISGNLYQNSNIFTSGGGGGGATFPLNESGTEGQTDTFYLERYVTTGNPAVDIVFDDQEPTTTFTGTLDGTATRVTGTNGTGYLQLTPKSNSLDNTVYWQDTLPSKWTCEFEWYLDPGSYGGADDSRFIFYGQNPITSVFPQNHGAPYVWIEHYGGDTFAICDGSGASLASIGITFAVRTWIRFKIEFDNGVLTAHAYNNQTTPTTLSHDFGSTFSSYYNTDTYFAIGARTGGVNALQRARNFHVYEPSSISTTLSNNYTIDNSNSSSMNSLRLSDVTNGLSVISNVSVGGTIIASQLETNSITTNNLNILLSNVGIGTSSPVYKLDVDGDINFTGNLYQNETVFSGGGDNPVGSIICDMTRGTSSFTLSTGGNHVYVFNTTFTNTGSSYNTGNGQFKPTTAGWYLITWCIVFQLNSSNANMEAFSSVHKNNSFFMWGNNFHTTNAHYHSTNGASLVYFNGSTDYAHIEFYHNSGSNATMNPNGSAFPSRFQAIRLT
jgi:hypothetical protein